MAATIHIEVPDHKLATVLAQLSEFPGRCSIDVTWDDYHEKWIVTVNN